MREKLKSSRGETLVEVLASVLVCALSIALLAGAVSASVRIDLQAREADSEYYEVLSRAEAQNFDDRMDALFGKNVRNGVSISVVNDGADPNRKPINVYFYGSDRLLSYAPEPGGAP